MQFVLKYCQDLMAGEVLKHKNKQSEDAFRKCHDDISILMSKFLAISSTLLNSIKRIFQGNHWNDFIICSSLYFLILKFI